MRQELCERGMSERKGSMAREHSAAARGDRPGQDESTSIQQKAEQRSEEGEYGYKYAKSIHMQKQDGATT